ECARVSRRLPANCGDAWPAYGRRSRKATAAPNRTMIDGLTGGAIDDKAAQTAERSSKNQKRLDRPAEARRPHRTFTHDSDPLDVEGQLASLTDVERPYRSRALRFPVEPDRPDCPARPGRAWRTARAGPPAR